MTFMLSGKIRDNMLTIPFTVFTTVPSFENNVDPDQLISDEAK